VASASASDGLNCAVSGASSGSGEGRKIKDALPARETVEQVDDFAGRVKAKRVEFAPRTTLSSLAERLNHGRRPDGEVVANQESGIRKLIRNGWATVPSGASADSDSCFAGTRPAGQSATAADSGRNASGPDERRNRDERMVFR
jgi:hypothetical protein